DEADLKVMSVITTLVDNADALVLPSGTVSPGGGPGTQTGDPTRNALDYLGAEILEGQVSGWMTSGVNVFTARVRKEITVQYLGNDPVILAKCPGPGPTHMLKISAMANVTNGTTREYSQPTSQQNGETVPVGLAQVLQEGLSVLHYSGQVEITDRE